MAPALPMDAEEAVARLARPLRGAPEDFDALLDDVGDARLVLLGEATHGSHDFYRLRTLITRRLIREKGFAAIAVEGDWPDCARVDRFVRGRGSDGSPIDALGDFRRFPSWMWRNADVLDLVGWLREHDAPLPETRRAAFYGLDLYSLHSSMDAVVRYLESKDARAAEEARRRFACFDLFGADAETYGWAASLSEQSCEAEAVQQLVDLRRRRGEMLERDGARTEDEHFEAEQNARVVAGAERYYRTMMGGRDESWNLRDTHMADTLDALLAHVERRTGTGKIVVWAHNSHLGDARATGMAGRGELNLGQLVRERHGAEAVRLVGFTTASGTVTAANDWNGPAERMSVRPPLPGSWEALFHGSGLGSFHLPLRGAPASLREARLERFIGVLYRPSTERHSHYSPARLADQFDAVFHLDVTRAVEPLERVAPREEDEAPETFPTGM